MKQYKEFEYDAKLADRKIKFCSTCKRCWEIDKEASKTAFNRKIGRKIYSYYEDFPRYGKQIEECATCQGG